MNFLVEYDLCILSRIMFKLYSEKIIKRVEAQGPNETVGWQISI